MPDAFFQRKRKRASTSGTSRPKLSAGRSAPKRRAKDSDLSSEESDGAGDGIADLDLRHDFDAVGSDEEAEGEDKETPQETRLRLAKMYLEGLQRDVDETEVDAAQIDRDIIAARLQKDVLEHDGKMHLRLAEQLVPPSPSSLLSTRGHRLSVTSAVASDDGKSLFTAGKEGTIIRWNLDTGVQTTLFPRRGQAVDVVRHKEKRLRAKGKANGAMIDKTEEEDLEQSPKPAPTTTTNGERFRAVRRTVARSADQGHQGEVLTLAISSDGKWLTSGGRDKRVGVWDVGKIGEESWVRGFGGHKDAITALVFRSSSTELFTACLDRTVKVFDLSQMTYVDTLFGHQDSIQDIDALQAETAVTVGGRDKTARFWKVRDESQLVFRGGGRSKVREVIEGGGEDMEEMLEEAEGGPAEDGEPAQAAKKAKPTSNTVKFVEGSIDCVAMIDESNFVTGGDSGSLCLWNIGRKKPVFTYALAHGLHEHVSETEGVVGTPRWITAVAALRYGDVFASGSWEGMVRLWAIQPSLRSFSPLFEVPAVGFVNSLQFVLPPPPNAILPDRWSRRKPRDGEASTRQNETSTVLENQGEPETGERVGQEGSLITKDGTPAPVLVIGVGQEHKTGRWMRIKEARNGAIVVPFRFKTS